eukprot:COSAG01_NODE_3557_length_5939_cov_4.468151_6_plen_298_part_00
MLAVGALPVKLCSDRNRLARAPSALGSARTTASPWHRPMGCFPQTSVWRGAESNCGYRTQLHYQLRRGRQQCAVNAGRQCQQWPIGRPPAVAERRRRHPHAAPRPPPRPSLSQLSQAVASQLPVASQLQCCSAACRHISSRTPSNFRTRTAGRRAQGPAAAARLSQPEGQLALAQLGRAQAERPGQDRGQPIRTACAGAGHANAGCIEAGRCWCARTSGRGPVHPNDRAVSAVRVQTVGGSFTLVLVLLLLAPPARGRTDDGRGTTPLPATAACWRCCPRFKCPLVSSLVLNSRRQF